jgi:hypothetical protein
MFIATNFSRHSVDITHSRFCYLPMNRTEVIARLADDVCNGYKNLCFTGRWHKQHVRLSFVVPHLSAWMLSVLNTSAFTRNATSGHTRKIYKLFTSAYSGGSVGRFSREVGQAPAHTLAPKQRSPENLILQLYIIFHETRKPYSVTDK